MKIVCVFRGQEALRVFSLKKNKNDERQKRQKYADSVKNSISGIANAGFDA